MKVSDLTQAQTKQLEDAKDLVARQQAALDQLGPAMASFHEGKRLTRRETSTIMNILRWTPEEFDEFENMSKKDRQTFIDRTFATPYAYFYVGHDKDGANPTHRVYVTPSRVEIQDEYHPGF